MSEVGFKFKGGAGLEKVLQQLEKQAKRGGVLRAGFLEGATYPNGVKVATVAAANEFGDPKRRRPPRPFFRIAIAKHSKQWGETLAQIMAHNGYDVKTGLMMMGEVIKGQIQGSIVELQAPVLSAKTIRRKGFTKPLIDTSHMKNSVDYEVKQ